MELIDRIKGVKLQQYRQRIKLRIESLQRLIEECDQELNSDQEIISKSINKSYKSCHLSEMMFLQSLLNDE